MSDEVTAIIGDGTFANWVSYSVDLDFLSPSDAFTLTVADPTPAQVASIVEGTPLSLMVGTNLIMTGWIDEKRYTGSRSGDVMTLIGRDQVSPLVDCNVPISWTWKNITLAQLATKACLELGITLLVDAVAEASAPIAWVHAEPGETYWDILEREARRLRLMMWTSPGMPPVLHIGRPTYTGAPVGQIRRMLTQPLNADNNVKSVEVTWKISGRRSPVTVTGQAPGSMMSEAQKFSRQATDSGLVSMGLVRPAVIHDGGVRSAKAATDRAKWEVSRRQGEAWVARYTIPGHRPSADSVWEIDTLVDVADERLGVSGSRWISAIRFQKSRAGTETTLTLRELNAILPPV